MNLHSHAIPPSDCSRVIFKYHFPLKKKKTQASLEKRLFLGLGQQMYKMNIVLDSKEAIEDYYGGIKRTWVPS